MAEEESLISHSEKNIFEKRYLLASLISRPLQEMLVYKDLFNLKNIKSYEKVELKYFRILPADLTFVVIVLYNENDNLYFVRDYSSNSGWELPGGFCLENKSLIDSVINVVQREAPCKIAEVRPVCLCQNNFTISNESKIHNGIAFVARCLTKPKIVGKKKGEFLREIPQDLPHANYEITLLAKKFVKNRSSEIPISEVIANRKHRFTHLAHKYIVSPLIEPFSSKKLKNVILKNISKDDFYVLDISCGYDDLIFKLQKSGRVCIGNDISWEMVSYLMKRATSSGVVFTNQNLLDAQFEKKFDVLICKNTLHHLQSIDQMGKAIKHLASFTKKLIIMDIENPRAGPFRSRAWNTYYRKFLGDCGGLFLNSSQFTQMLRIIFPNKKIIFETIKTIKGDYLLSVIYQ